MTGIITRICIFMCLAIVVRSAEFATQLRKCRVTDKLELNSCLYQTLEELRPRLLTGIPELNLPSLEPMMIDNLVFRQGEGGVSVRANFNHVNVKGLSNFTTTNINADPTSMTLRMSLHVPKLSINGQYNLNGHIIFLPMQGSGDFFTNLFNVDASGISDLKIVTTPEGRQQLTITQTNIDFNIRKVNIKLHNLFGGDAILGETVNLFLNENSQEILREIKPEVVRRLNDLVRKVMNDALSQLPVDTFLITN